MSIIYFDAPYDKQAYETKQIVILNCYLVHYF